MTAKKKGTNKTAAAAAAAAAAAVKSIEEDRDGVQFTWSDADDDDDDAGEVNDEILTGLAQIDEQAGGEIVWWELYCDSPIDKQGQIRKLSTSEIKGVRDECLGLGPGEYHVIARHRKGTFIKGSRLRIKISGFARPAVSNTAAAPPAPAVDSLTLMQRWDERMEQRRQAARQERNQEIKFWAPILAPIGIELAKGLFGSRGGESIKDLVGALVGMKDLMGKNGEGTQVDTLLKGIELARELNPGEKGGTWPDMLINGIRELRPLAEAAIKRPAAAPAPAAPGVPHLQFAPASPAPAPQLTATDNTNNATPPGDEAMWNIIQPMLQRLAVELEEFAVNGADPGLAAEALLAKVPRLIMNQVTPQQLKEWLTQANWWQIVTQFRASLMPYQGFCDDVRLALLDMVEQQLNPTAAAAEGGEEDES